MFALYVTCGEWPEGPGKERGWLGAEEVCREGGWQSPGTRS